MLIDLHLHSTYSDGALSPAELVKLAIKNELAAISITDHDTTAGVDETIDAGKKNGLAVLPGVEISVFHNEAPMHILGYGFDQNNPVLQGCLNELQAIRRERNAGITARLNKLGIVIGHDEFAPYGTAQIGRPHFASILVKKQIVKTTEQAFLKFLRKNGPAYVPKQKFPAAKAITSINQAGGLAFLAHPGYTDPSFDSIPLLLKELKDIGLAGVEVYYPGHSVNMINTLKKINIDLNLLSSGGSDFHGKLKPRHFMVGANTDLKVPVDLFYDIVNYLSAQGN